MVKVLEMIFLLILVLISVAFFSLFERKFLSLIQSRKGPNKVGCGGILQPFSDALKLVSKVEGHPESSIKVLYYLSPLMIFCFSLFIWILFPSSSPPTSLVVGVLILLVFFSISTYGLIFSGWFSNSKYGAIGAGRALAQSISYEIGLSGALIAYCLVFASFNFSAFSSLQGGASALFALFPLGGILFVSLLAEMGRAPFDLPEGESELVSGYCIEYGGLSYTLIFLGENLSFLWSSVMMSSLFFSGIGCIAIIVFLLVWIRASVPRMRFDKVMQFFWVLLLPVELGVVIFYACFWFY